VANWLAEPSEQTAVQSVFGGLAVNAEPGTAHWRVCVRSGDLAGRRTVMDGIWVLRFDTGLNCCQDCEWYRLTDQTRRTPRRGLDDGQGSGSLVAARCVPFFSQLGGETDV